MKGIVLYSKKDAKQNAWMIQYLVNAFAENHIELECIYEEGLDAQNTPCDFVISRLRNADISAVFEKRGIRVFNSSRVNRIANDKYKAVQFVSMLGVRTMASTLYIPGASDNVYYPCILKSLDGHGGREVFLVHDNAELKNRVQQYPDKQFMLQKICSDIGIDYRAYVLDSQIIKVIRRSSDTDFRSNYSLGGKVIEIQDIPEEISQAVKTIASALRIDYAGIDFIVDHGHFVFNEIEDPVGARILYEATDYDILSAFVQLIIRKMSDGHSFQSL